MAFLFVTRIAVTIKPCRNQCGARMLKKTPTICTTIAKTMERLIVKNGILLTINPGTHMDWALAEAGRKSQAQTSEVSMARAVAPLNETKKILNEISGIFQTKLLVRELSFLKLASGPKVSPNNTKTQTVLRIEFKVKTNLNRFSWSSWMKCSGWKKIKITKKT